MAIYQRNVPLENDNNESGVGNCIEMEFMVGQADCRAKVILCDGEYDIDQNGNIVVLVGKQASLINCAPGMLDVNIVEQTVFPQYDNTGTGVADFYDNVTNVPGVHIEGYETGTPLRAATLSITIGGSPVSVSDISIRPMQTIANIGLMPKIAEWHIYGNGEQGRFAIKKPDQGDIYYLDALSSDFVNKRFSRILSFKEYELKDHLGNVRVAITDYKMPMGNDPTIHPRGILPFKVDERSVNDYYPYGMLIKERSWQVADYRYGYNGKENDNEVKGTGNSIDYGARIYDPRVARWLSRDPLEHKYVGWSGYNYVMNNPIVAIDPNGKEVYIATETKGTGHTFIIVKEGSSYTVYNYGRYQDVNYLTGGATGKGVLIKMTGNDAKKYIAESVDRMEAKIFEVKDVKEKNVKSIFDGILKSSNEKPKTASKLINENGKVVDTYVLTGNNCTTKSCESLKNSGSSIFKDDFLSIPFEHSFVIPSSLQDYLEEKSQNSPLIINRTEQVRNDIKKTNKSDVLKSAGSSGETSGSSGDASGTSANSSSAPGLSSGSGSGSSEQSEEEKK